LLKIKGKLYDIYRKDIGNLINYGNLKLGKIMNDVELVAKEEDIKNHINVNVEIM
jgi:hypothetical protein